MGIMRRVLNHLQRLHDMADRLSTLTLNFTIHEFDQDARHGLEAAPYPGAFVRERLIPLCQQLEVIRETLGGKPIYVLSGYRTEAYNRKIGGARQSQHVQGRAADIIVDGVTPDVVYQTILDLAKAGKIAIGGLGKYPGFTHVDIREGKRLALWEGKRTTT